MICPHCQKQIPEGTECPLCGIIIAKYRPSAEGQRPTAKREGLPKTPSDTTKRPLTPIQLKLKLFKPERPWLLRPVSDSRLAGVYGQLGRMLESGVPLVESLRLLAKRSRGRLGRSLDKVRMAVETGTTLSEALWKDPVLFHDQFRSLVEAGEKTGTLPAIFHSLSASLELRLRMRRRMLRASIYPFILFTLSFFLPRLDLLITQGLPSYLSASLVPYLYALLGLGALLTIVPWLLRRILGVSLMDQIKRHIPVVGGIYQLGSSLRFSRRLANSLGAGLDVYSSLRLSARATGDNTVVRKIEEAAGKVEQGASLDEAIGSTGLFHEEFMLALASGEASGRLEESLEQQARLFEEAYLHRLEVMVQLGAVLVLLLVYAYVAWSVFQEYNNVLGGVSKQIDGVLKEVGGSPLGSNPLGGAGKLPPELREILH